MISPGNAQREYELNNRRLDEARERNGEPVLIIRHQPNAYRCCRWCGTDLEDAQLPQFCDEECAASYYY